MVDVEHGALGTLEQDAAAGALELGQAQPDRLGERQQLGGERQEFRQQLVAVDLLDAEAAAQGVVVDQQLVDLGRQGVGVGEVADPDGTPCRLVLVGRADAAAGGADLAGTLIAAFAGELARPVQLAVQRQDQGRVLGDAQGVGADGDALGAQALDLLEQGPGVDHDTVADQRELALAHHARGQERELVGDAVDDQRVAGIVAALEAHHHVGPLAEPVDDLALALVAPLGADHRDIAHGFRLDTGTLPGALARRVLHRRPFPGQHDGGRARAGNWR